MVASEPLGAHVATVGTHELVPPEQCSVREWNGRALVALGAPPLQYQDAFQRDLGVKTCVAILPAGERELVVAKAIGDLTESLLANGVLPGKPPRRETRDVDR